jgi:hypothetical protein
MKVLTVLFYVLFAMPFIALPFLLVNWGRYMKTRAENRSRLVPLPTKVPIKSVIFFAGPIIVLSVIAPAVSWRARIETLTFLQDLSGKYEVYVDSHLSRDPDKIVAALKTVTPKLGHHSHPTKMIRVDIQSDKGRLTLVLGRDSGYGQEYWVFYPKYRITSENEIGRVTTALLDEY